MPTAAAFATSCSSPRTPSGRTWLPVAEERLRGCRGDLPDTSDDDDLELAGNPQSTPTRIL
jgi:hypothetical protein